MKKWNQIFNSVMWKLVIIYLLLMTMAMQIISVFFLDRLEERFISEMKESVKKQAAFIKGSLVDELSSSSNIETQKKQMNQILNQRSILNKESEPIISVADDKGIIITSTQPVYNTFEKLSLPDHYLEKKGNDQYFLKKVKDAEGRTVQPYMMPLKDDKNGRLLGYLYIEVPLHTIYNKTKTISKTLTKITAVAFFITGILMIILARTISLPVKAITLQSTAMTAGDFERRVPVKSKDEIGLLAQSFNDLAAHLRVALKEKEEEKLKLESVLAHMSDGVIASNSFGKVIVKNQRAEQLLEKNIELGEHLESVLSLRSPIAFPMLSESHQYMSLHDDDPELQTTLKLTFTPTKLLGEERHGLVVVIVDVTEQEKLERQRKDFVANVSHELRTPLTTIKSYLEALDDGVVEEPELARRFLSVTQQEAERMTRLITDLLQLTRLDAKKSKFVKQQIETKELITDAYQRFFYQCKQHHIMFSLYTAKEIDFIYGDRDKLNQVLDNLISNAIKYTPDGGSIALIADLRWDGLIEIGIADTGIGIPQKDLGRIFERFYRVDKARSRSLGGTGLGLSIAREIIHAHHGEIEMDSVYQKGTLVSFTLPPSNRR
ncbi:HAMP domain-containing protein [Hazenella sp. IB182353]|uniref:ATP-binding protein n=1 Tax=Polycladospora coralii TaxID=2771432 RepID=UPI0017464097|nr:ATP-binding protein [Polycladospora coralii]MBS7530515.1 HAMP domain-containing protein [Polycladospora coralii]